MIDIFFARGCFVLYGFSHLLVELLRVAMPSSLSTMKRPGSQVTKSTLKRPASSGQDREGQVNGVVKKLKEGWQNDDDKKAKNAKKGGKKKTSEEKDESKEEGEGSGGENEQDDELRDKGKSLKFTQMRKNLPSHIQHLYDVEASNKTSPRAFRTSIINQLFKRLPNGRYELVADQPFFNEAKKLYEKKYGKESEQGFPKAVMRGLYFHNDEKAFNQALEDGDIYRISSEGKEFFAFQSVETGRERPRGCPVVSCFLDCSPRSVLSCVSPWMFEFWFWCL